MHTSPRRAWIVALAFALLGPGTQGCALMMATEGHEGGSGSLSQAVAQVSPDTLHRFKSTPPPPDVGYTTPPVTEVEVVVPAPAIADGAAASPPPAGKPWVDPYKGRHRFFLGLAGGYGAFGGRTYDRLETMGLMVSGYPEPRIRVDGIFSGAGMAFTDQTFMRQAFQEPIELNLDVVGRWYVTHEHTFMGLYPLAGVGTGTLFWDYARPVTVIENGRAREISDDRLNHFSFFGGAGASLVQTRFVHLGGQLHGGVRFYGWHTGNGLRNDMLRPTGYLKLLVDLSFYVTKT